MWFQPHAVVIDLMVSQQNHSGVAIVWVPAGSGGGDPLIAEQDDPRELQAPGNGPPPVGISICWKDPEGGTANPPFPLEPVVSTRATTQRHRWEKAQ